MKVQNQSLSDYKSKKKPSMAVRNVLANPRVSLWPTLSTCEGELLRNQLEECLKTANVNKYKPSSLKKNYGYLKLKRKSKQSLEELSLKKQEDLSNDTHHSKYLLCGVNSVSRGIEEGKVECCLLAEEAKPKILVKHIAALAQNACVATLVFPNLKIVTQQSLGFACLALAFKKPVMNERNNMFSGICNSIKELAKHSSLPSQAKCFSSINDPSELLKSLKTCNLRKKIALSETDNNTSYLYRSSNSFRVFIPPSSSDVSTLKNDANNDEFMPLINDISSSWMNVTLQKNSKRVAPFQYIQVCSSNSVPEKILTDISMNEDVEEKNDNCVFSKDTLDDEQCTLASERIRNYQCPKVFRFQSNPNKVRKNKCKKKII